MTKLVEKSKPPPANSTGASVIQLGLQKTDDYLDNLVTEEYNFQRESLYTTQIPPQLIAGSLLVSALAGYIVTYVGKSAAPNTQYLAIYLSVFLFSMLVLILAGSLVIRRKHPKVDNFAIETKILEKYQHEILLFEEQSDLKEEVDTLILAKLRLLKIMLLRDQINLCRKENRYRHNIQIVMTFAILAALLTGAIVAGSIAVFAG